MLKHLFSSDEKLKWWGNGEWIEEPDLEEFLYKGLKCRIKRIIAKEKSGNIFGGHLCGYVQLPPSQQEINGNRDFWVDHLAIHGGITYCQYEDDGFVWIGFDCAHSGDLIPSINFLTQDTPVLRDYVSFTEISCVYKNFEYVKEEVKNLADQILEFFKDYRDLQQND